MVKLSTIWGNLSKRSHYFSLPEKKTRWKERDAYKAAKRMAKLAPVVSLAQTCAGGNQSAFEATTFSNLLEHEEGIIYAHGTQMPNLPRPSTSPVSRWVARVSGRQRAGQTL
jgi:hypothetical protein